MFNKSSKQGGKGGAIFLNSAQYS